MTDIGLGIGVDYGPVRLATIGDGLTVVGQPVVYACRLSGAPPAVTLANQAAYEAIVKNLGSNCFVSEINIDIKHEGRMLAYQVALNTNGYSPKEPDWAQTDEVPDSEGASAECDTESPELTGDQTA